MPTMAIPSVKATFSKLACDEQSSSTFVLSLSHDSVHYKNNADNNILGYEALALKAYWIFKSSSALLLLLCLLIYFCLTERWSVYYE